MCFWKVSLNLGLFTFSDVSCDVHIKLDAVSPIHCTLIAMLDGRVVAENHVKPATRTLLNGEPIIGRTFVPHNSLLTIGDRYFKFLYPEVSEWTNVGVPVSYFWFVSYYYFN